MELTAASRSGPGQNVGISPSKFFVLPGLIDCLVHQRYDSYYTTIRCMTIQVYIPVLRIFFKDLKIAQTHFNISLLLLVLLM